MSRVKRGVTSHQKHKKILSLTKGYRHGRKNLVKRAKEALLKAGFYAYRDRRARKRDFRRLWNTQINAAVREKDLSYSQFIAGMKKANLDLNRKVLAELSTENKEIFDQIVQKVKGAIEKEG